MQGCQDVQDQSTTEIYYPDFARVLLLQYHRVCFLCGNFTTDLQWCETSELLQIHNRETNDHKHLIGPYFFSQFKLLYFFSYALLPEHDGLVRSTSACDTYQLHGRKYGPKPITHLLCQAALGLKPVCIVFTDAIWCLHVLYYRTGRENITDQLTNS